jgi:cysteinyl-tRNA synthetase
MTNPKNPEIYLFNTIARQKERFVPVEPNIVKYYHCGPTVYSYQHIGNYRSAYFSDLVVRSFKFLGYNVKFVTNMTDVGHLDGDNAGDADRGEDRMQKAARKEGKTSLEIAEFYAKDFLNTCSLLNLSEPDFRPRPTQVIPEQIEMVQSLLDKGYAYFTDYAVYFDVSKFKEYGKLSKQKLEDKQAGARDEVFIDPGKRNPQDFALWMFTVGHQNAHELRWSSPFSEKQGFPGWHIECSAMSLKHLGYPIDIHSGGKEHIPIHHENEIAQSECSTDKEFVNYWLHLEHLMVEGKKMSKSLGNVYTVTPNNQFDSVVDHDFDPLDLRLFYMQSHYQTAQNFTWQNLESARNLRLKIFKKLEADFNFVDVNLNILNDPDMYDNDLFWESKNALADNLNSPEFLETVSRLSNITDKKTKLATFVKLDEVLGLDILKHCNKPKNRELIRDGLKKRQEFKRQGDFESADKIKNDLMNKFSIEIIDLKDESSWVDKTH